MRLRILFLMLFAVMLYGCDNAYVAPNVAKAKSEQRQEAIEERKCKALERQAEALEKQAEEMKKIREHLERG